MCIRDRDEAVRQLKKLFEKAVSEVGEANAMIFDIHQMMVTDLDYCESVSYTHLDVYKRQHVYMGKAVCP